MAQKVIPACANLAIFTLNFMKHIAPQFELPMMEAAFNLAGETQRAPDTKPVAKADLTPEMFAGLTPESIADATTKAQLGYMDRFFPPACANFQPSPTSENHCRCGIIKSAH